MSDAVQLTEVTVAELLKVVLDSLTLRPDQINLDAHRWSEHKKVSQAITKLESGLRKHQESTHDLGKAASDFGWIRTQVDALNKELNTPEQNQDPLSPEDSSDVERTRIDKIFKLYKALAKNSRQSKKFVFDGFKEHTRACLISVDPGLENNLTDASGLHQEYWGSEDCSRLKKYFEKSTAYHQAEARKASNFESQVDNLNMQNTNLTTQNTNLISQNTNLTTKNIDLENKKTEFERSVDALKSQKENIFNRLSTAVMDKLRPNAEQEIIDEVTRELNNARAARPLLVALDELCIGFPSKFGKLSLRKDGTWGDDHTVFKSWTINLKTFLAETRLQFDRSLQIRRHLEQLQTPIKDISFKKRVALPTEVKDFIWDAGDPEWAERLQNFVTEQLHQIDACESIESDPRAKFSTEGAQKTHHEKTRTVIQGFQTLLRESEQQLAHATRLLKARPSLGSEGGDGSPVAVLGRAVPIELTDELDIQLSALESAAARSEGLWRQREQRFSEEVQAQHTSLAAALAAKLSVIESTEARNKALWHERQQLFYEEAKRQRAHLKEKHQTLDAEQKRLTSEQEKLVARLRKIQQEESRLQRAAHLPSVGQLLIEIDEKARWNRQCIERIRKVNYLGFGLAALALLLALLLLNLGWLRR